MQENTSNVQQNTPKEEKKESLFLKILNIFLWILLFIWMGICLIDFYNVHDNKAPKFCIKEGVNKYDDGTVEWCTGLGYKVYRYNRSSFRAVEFGPFWRKDRTSKKDN